MCRNSQRILVEAAYIGVFRREESSLRRIPQSSLPVPKFAAKVVPCSYPLREGSSSKSHFSFSPCQPILVKWHNVEKMHHRSRRNTYFQLLIVFVYWGAATTLPLVPVLIQMRTHWVEIVLIWNTKRMPYESRYSNREPSKSSFYFVTTVKLKKQALHAGQGTHGDAVMWIRSDIFSPI